MSKTTLNLEQQQEKVKVDLAAMFRLTAMYGWDDTIWNHITARVPGSDHHFYMHRFGLSYEEVCASNLIKVDGGMVKNNWFTQFLSNTVNLKVVLSLIHI